MHVADIAGSWGVGDFVFGVQRAQRREQQSSEEDECWFHGCSSVVVTWVPWLMSPRLAPDGSSRSACQE